MVLLTYAVVCVAPVLIFVGVEKLFKFFGSIEDRRRRRNRKEPSLAELVADLHRIEQQSRRLRESDVPAMAHRLHAMELAYDDLLRRCQAALGLEPGSEPPLSPFERLQTEAELSKHGLTW